MTDLYFIGQPEFERIGKLPVTAEVRTALVATLCRINTLYMIKRAGSGHIGSSFSSLDIVAWLMLNEIDEQAGDVYYSSKGHDVPGFYAVLLGLGRLPFEKIHTLRRLDGLPGHPDVGTPGIVANTGSLGMGVSKAKGMVTANRLRGKDGRVFVLTGDGELQEGQFWESLPSAVHQGMSEITVIVDHNKVQSDTLVSRVNDLGDLDAKFRAYGWQVFRCDGHDVAALRDCLEGCAALTDRPQVIIADTIKGRGVSFMEHTAMAPDQRLYRFHSGAPDDDAYRRAAEELLAKANVQLQACRAAPLEIETRAHLAPPSLSGLQRLIPAYSEALVQEAEHNPMLVAFDADLAMDCGLLPFEQRYPRRFIECGIAEQDMVSQAGALALKGFLPVVHSFACFLAARPNEQIYNNATEHSRVVYVGSLAGLLPGMPGHSHQAVRDIAALSAVPGLTLLQPSCEQEVAMALRYCVRDATGSSYLRLASIPCAVPYRLPPDYRLSAGRGVVLREGDDGVLISYGPVMLGQAWQAARELEEQSGLRIRLINLPWLNMVEAAWLREAIRGCRWLFTLDDHYVAGGQGQMIAATLGGLALMQPPQIHHFGVQEIPRCGQHDEVLRAHGLDAASLAEMLAHLIVSTGQRGAKAR